ncbi:hypothetical protein H2198_007649 [Neophaeococcomyces mojaviensis]|uniref:Uncharacterized protein n=1 Tax=Neophaeococcomyces mojaviensis TaxID=3383035 RepID=A0ACC2ZZK5_9EURO|nr:hypothetical protein H2198_007649 [Knufia sp. JES_112]
MAGTHERPSKRRKQTHEPSEDALTSADEIHYLLEFRQSAEDAVAANIDKFKAHLVAISRMETASPKRAKQLQVLLEYSQWQRSASADQVDLYDLLATWSFAVEQNAAEAVLTAVPEALAEYLNAISGSLDHRSFGLSLIDSLLRRDQSKLFGKGLATSRTKPHLAAPCLRLLTQMAAFDGGARANEIWMRRDLFIHKSDILLEHKEHGKREQEEGTNQGVTLRPLTTRLLLTLIKCLDAACKTELLNQGRALHGMLHGLLQESQQTILEVLVAIEASFLNDSDVARASLQRFFNSTHLEAIAVLYSFEAEDAAVGVKASVREAAHGVLQKLCTTNKGIILPQQGWYPPSTSSSTFQSADDDYIDLGLESLTFRDDYTNSVPVKNVTLSNFIQRLRPQQDVLQSSLLIDILNVTPELVADYFSKRKQISPPNSEDAAWRGTFALLFSIIESPIPQPLRLADRKPRHPPPTTVVIESIIPRPLDRSYIQKLFSSDEGLLKISGARLLTVVLTKLGQVLMAFSTHLTSNAYLWEQARTKLLELVQARIPVVRDVTLALQHTSSTSADNITAILECLALYYRTLPNVSASATFDVSPTMAGLCSKLEGAGLDSDASEQTVDQLRYCVQIAELTSSTKWLQKSDNDSLSPLGQLLKVTYLGEAASGVTDIVRTVERVLLHRGILNHSHSFNAMSSSLKPKKQFKHFSPMDECFLFLDNSITRANQKPVKYLDEIEAAQQLLSDKKPLSLLAASVAEQWQFATKKHEGKKSVVKNIALFVAQFFANLDKAGENYRVMQQLKESMMACCDGKVARYLEDAFDKVDKQPTSTPFEAELYDVKINDKFFQQDLDEPTSMEETFDISEFEKLLHGNIEVPSSLEGLDKWPLSMDIELEIRSNRLSRLVLGLLSPDEEIRLQSVQLLQSIAHTIDTSSPVAFEPKPQVFLLLSELLGTIKHHGLTTGLPTIVPQLAHQLLHVMINPGDKMYAKANKFLLHTPTWDWKRLINYWVDKILLREPGTDDTGSDAWTVEVTWLLNWLASSVRTEQDMDLYRRSGTWERIMSLYGSPVLRDETRKLVLALLWKGFQVSGGVDTLWTRFGVQSWLQAMSTMDMENSKVLVKLSEAMDGSCDKVGIERWSLSCAQLKTSSVAVN